MEEKRIGFGLRLGAAALDGALSGVAALVILVVVASAGGVGLGLRYQEITGGRIVLRSFFDGTFSRRIEQRSTLFAEELEREFTSRFSPQQAERMAQVVGGEMERMFLPAEAEAIWPALRRFAAIDRSTLEQAVDRAFRALEAEKIEGVSSQDLAAIRAEVDAFVRELGLSEFLPDLIRYAIGVAICPLLGLLAYGLVEAFAGASVGKMILGLRIGDLGGARAPMGLTLLRYLVKSSGAVLLVVAVAARAPVLVPVAVVEYAVILFGSLAMLGEEKRALHDHIVGTAVYRASEMAEGA